MMSENGKSSGHEMIYLAAGVALGALGASLILSNNSVQRRLTSATRVEPKHHGIFWPWGALVTAGGAAAVAASLAPDIARYVRIETM